MHMKLLAKSDWLEVNAGKPSLVRFNFHKELDLPGKTNQGLLKGDKVYLKGDKEGCALLRRY